jgi:hypothetical protein
MAKALRKTRRSSHPCTNDKMFDIEPLTLLGPHARYEKQCQLDKKSNA